MKTFWKEALCSLLVLGICAYAQMGRADRVAASAQHPGYTPVNFEQAAQKALERNPALMLVQVSVTRRNDAVLTGTVEHYQDKVEAENAVRSIPGIRGIENQIEVDTPSVEDGELQKRLEDRLHYEWAGGGLGLTGVQVSSQDGVVTLSGTVRSPVEHSLALAIAGSTDGVTAVHDQLRTAPDVLDDAEARIQIEKLLHSSYPGVHATFANGIVTLMGQAPGPQQKEKLISKIHDMYGVIEVDDQMVTPGEKTSDLHLAALPCGEQQP